MSRGRRDRTIIGNVYGKILSDEVLNKIDTLEELIRATDIEKAGVETWLLRVNAFERWLNENGILFSEYLRWFRAYEKMRDIIAKRYYIKPLTTYLLFKYKKKVDGWYEGQGI